MWVFMAVAAAEGGPGCAKEARPQQIIPNRLRLVEAPKPTLGCPLGSDARTVGSFGGNATGPGDRVEGWAAPFWMRRATPAAAARMPCREGVPPV